MEKPVKAIVNGTLINGTGAPPLKDSVIIIEGPTIAEVGQVGHVRIPGDAEIINAKHRIVLPGLIDCHTHISEGITASPATGWGTLEYSIADKTILAILAVKKLLGSGITTIRDLGSSGHIDIAVRDAINQGCIVGPRIFASDAGITITGGHNDMVKSVRALAFEGITLGDGIADGTTECIKTVRKQIRVGADQIKIWATGGVMEVTARAGIQELSEEEIRTIIKEANRFNRFVAAHAVGPPKAIKTCAEAGVRSIEHGIFNDKESMEAMRQNRVYLVPTLVAYELLKKEIFPPTTREVAKKATTAHKETIKMAKKVGVKIAMGTDSGAPYGSVHGECQAQELELLVKSGLTEMEAIVAATKTAAECIGIDATVGTIEPGKFADIIIVDGDPLEDIKVLQNKNRIKMVIKEGNIYVKR